MNGTMTGAYLFLKIKDTLSSLELSWAGIDKVTNKGSYVHKLWQSDGVSLNHSSAGTVMHNFPMDMKEVVDTSI
jgi:hypothetical protein